MLAYYEVGSLIVIILGFSFGLVWAADRANKAALYWSVSHLALAFAVLTGMRANLDANKEPALISLILAGPFELNQVLILISSVLTGLFLATMYAAIQALRDRDLGAKRIVLASILVTLVISLVGFGLNRLLGRLLVLVMIVLLFIWAGWFFLRKLRMPWVGLAFLLRAASFASQLSSGEKLSTPEQNLPVFAFGWATATFLGLVLIYVSVRQSRQRLEQVLKHLPDALVVKKLDNSVLLCNERFAELAGVSKPDELIGRPVPNLFANKAQGECIDREIGASAHEGLLSEPVRLESDIRQAHAEEFPAEIIYSRFDDWGKPVIVAQIRDISERKAAEEERLRLLATDQLTGLPNWQSLEVQLSSILCEQERNHLGCAILIIALDHFKKINDAFGHEKGNAVLLEIAEVLKCSKGDRDLIGRIGGDEFALVMTDLDNRCPVLEVDERAQEITSKIERQIRNEDVSVMVGASVGIAFSHPGDTNPGTLLQRAQIAVYSAKERGRGEWCYFNDDMDSRMLSLLKIESALRSAISGNEMSLNYQPIVDARNGRTVKAEALARWFSPTLGPVSPPTFIPIAEKSSLILDVGFWILEEAIRQAASWSRELKDPPVVGINVSVRQFLHADFEARLASATAKHGVPPSLIDLEITESLFANSNDEDLLAKFERLQNAGYGLSLDDFGTGYSALSYLVRFKLNTVKIDRSFVSGVDQDSKKLSIVKAIISMGKNLGLSVVAEGVETEAERQLLVDEGCDLLQGFLFSKPVAAHVFPMQVQIALRHQEEQPERY